MKRRKKNVVLTFCLSAVMKDLLWDFFKTPLEPWEKVELIQFTWNSFCLFALCFSHYFFFFPARLFAFTCVSHWLVQMQTHIVEPSESFKPWQHGNWKGCKSWARKVEQGETEAPRRQKGRKLQRRKRRNAKFSNAAERGGIAIKVSPKKTKTRELKISICNTQQTKWLSGRASINRKQREFKY